MNRFISLPFQKYNRLRGEVDKPYSQSQFPMYYTIELNIKNASKGQFARLRLETCNSTCIGMTGA